MPAVTVANSIIAKNHGTADGADVSGDFNNRLFTSLGNNLLTSVRLTTGAGFINGVSNDLVRSFVDYVVTDIGDTLNAGNDNVARSLREAIWASNANGGEIWAPGWRFEMTLAGSGGVTQGDFDVSSLVTVRGVGAGETVIDASALRLTSTSDRVFEVSSGATLNLTGLTVTGGRTLDSGGGVLVNDGGTVNLSYSAIVGNATPNHGGGGIEFLQSGGGTITNSVITGNISNTSGGYGGGVELYYPDNTPGHPYAAVIVTNSIIAQNTGAAGGEDIIGDYGRRFFTSGGNNLLTTVPSNGGAGFTNGVSNDLVSNSVSYVVTDIGDTLNAANDNIARSLREAIWASNTGGGTIWAPGWRFGMTLAGSGGVTQGDFDLSSSMTIRGVAAGETVIDASALRGANSDRVLEVSSGVTLNLIGVTVTGGKPTVASGRSGGGILVHGIQSLQGTLNLSYSAIVGNSTPDDGGGGIYFEQYAGGAITSSVITGNTSSSSYGGGINLQYPSATPGLGYATVTVANSIIAKNTGTADGADVSGDYNNRLFSSLGHNRLTTVRLNTGAGFVNGERNDYVDSSVNYVVTGLADTYDGSIDQVVMSLRDAITLANTTAGAEEIWLPAWNFVLTRERLPGQTTDMDASFGDLDIGIALGQPVSDASLTIRGVDDATKVGWRPGAIPDKVFELLGDYDPNLTIDSMDRYIYSVSLATQNLTADGDDDGDVDSNDLAVRDANYDNWLWMPGVTVV